MTTNVISVGPQTSVHEVARLLSERGYQRRADRRCPGSASRHPQRRV
ncbi:MAG: hypothetical protein J2P48_21995, partial [Alphaproteobacteria bacterium]|nr:hypothetical protein [Alphaproteobacteria bacterium]